MKITKASASAINLYDHCSFAYFLRYIVGMDSTTGKAALQGSIVHKTIEWIAKLSRRHRANVDSMWLLDRAWDKLTSEHKYIDIRKTTTRIDKDTGQLKEAADFKKCRQAIENILSDKFYNPYNLNIIDIEKWFAIEMPGKDWECIDKNDVINQFTIRGFIDVVNKIDDDTIEIIDWKTGNRKSFYTQEDIDEYVLMNEVQPRLYHLAAYFLYPQYKNILITFYYANEDGPVTITLSEDDLTNTIAFLNKFLKTVNRDTLLQRNKTWKCKMCSFYKNDVCDKVWSDLHTMGGDYVHDKYSKIN